MADLAAFQPPPHTAQHWHVQKPGAKGKGGMVASQCRGAAEVGAAALEAGGTAADAALATAFALAVLEPWNSGLGGIGFGQVMKPGMARAETVDFGPRSPAGLDPALFPLTGGGITGQFAWPEVKDDRNIHGPLSFCIPSALAGYMLLHRRYGKLPMAELLAPAVAYAKRGMAADWFAILKILTSAPVLRNYAESARIYLPNGLPPIPPYQGAPAMIKQGHLADTLEQLQRAGLQDFYTGEIAEQIVSDTKEMGGVLSAKDLAECKAEMRPAMEINWRGKWRLQLAAGLTAAPTFAAVAEAMAGEPTPAKPDAEWYAAFARAMKGAYAARLAGLGAATVTPPPALAEAVTGHTTHISAVDKDGMMVALTTTLMSTMGSNVVLPKSGILMNNGVVWFDPRPGTPNAIGPNKRPLTNMCPIIAVPAAEGAAPSIVCGAAGGRRILAAIYQLLTFVADFGMDPDTAAHQPRIDVSSPDSVLADRRLPKDVIDRLAADGPVTPVEHTAIPSNFAWPNLIKINKDGTRSGTSDAMSPWSAAIAEA